MFRKMRRKFVLINLTCMVAVFLLIFAITFGLLVQNTNRQTQNDLEVTLKSQPDPSPDNPMLASSIVLELDLAGNIEKITAYTPLRQADLTTIYSNIILPQKNDGHIQLADTPYAYQLVQEADGSRIAFVDESRSHAMLRNVLLVFLAAGLGGVGLLYLLSLYLAYNVVHPIEETFQKQQRFIADTSHELKTPLTIMNTSLSLLTDNETATIASQRRWLDTLFCQVERMSKLVGDMLLLARLDAGVEKNGEKIDFSHLLSGSLLSFEALTFEKGQQLTSQITPHVMVYANSASLQRLIDILLDNAIKNTPKGETIQVSLAQEREQACLQVMNYGASLPQEEFEKIFQRFYRPDASRNRETGGSGLGLAIAQSIVQQWQGNIQVTSDAHSVTFTIYFPLWHSERLLFKNADKNE